LARPAARRGPGPDVGGVAATARHAAVSSHGRAGRSVKRDAPRKGGVVPCRRSSVRPPGVGPAPAIPGASLRVSSGDQRSDGGVLAAGRPPFGSGAIARVWTTPATGGRTLTDRTYETPPRLGGTPSAPVRRIGIAVSSGIDPARTRAFGLPNLRRNV